MSGDKYKIAKVTVVDNQLEIEFKPLENVCSPNLIYQMVDYCSICGQVFKGSETCSACLDKLKESSWVEHRIID
jgi:recombinational DNA repair protein RecR